MMFRGDPGHQHAKESKRDGLAIGARTVDCGQTLGSM
jgi:hypothetical protein